MLLRAAPHGALSGAALAAGRQVDLAPLPDAGGDGRGREPRSRACSRARTCWPRPAPCAPWAWSSSATGAGSWRVVGRRRGRARRARGRARPRQCRHRRPAADGPPGRPRLHQLPHRRRLACARRPMRRVIEPLGRMGASFRRPQRRSAAAGADRPHRPAADRLREPGRLGPGQVGRAAGRPARARAPPRVIEPQASRDHTERMLAAMGAEVDGRGAAGRRPAGDHQGPAGAAAAELRRAGRPVLGRRSPPWRRPVPPGSRVRLEGVGLNPLRTGLYTTLREMGADYRVEGERTAGGEPVGDLVVRGGGAARASRCRPSGRRR